MSRVLILSSSVAHGHVGLSAATPVLQALGHEVTALPSIILSNHPGWPHVAGHRMPPQTLSEMIGALAANGWLATQDAVLTGYLPTPAHVSIAAQLIARVRAANPRIRVVVDPVIGDTPKGLYIAPEAAHAIRDQLIGLADVLTPNAFELGWLCGSKAGDSGIDTPARAAALARQLAPDAEVLITSPPVGPGQTGLIRTGPTGTTQVFRLPARDGVPNGTGDVLAALIAAGLAPGAALGHLRALIDASLGAQHLRIIETAAQWSAAVPLSPDP